MTRYDRVWALFANEEAANDSIADLAVHGIAESDVEVTVPRPGRYRVAEEELHGDISGTRRGAMLAGVAGAVVGAVVVGLLVTDAGAGAYAIGAFAGGGFAAMIGAMVGLQRREPMDEAEERWVEVAPGTAQRLVTVHYEHVTYKAHHVLEQHGAVFLDDAAPHGSSATSDRVG